MLDYQKMFSVCRVITAEAAHVASLIASDKAEYDPVEKSLNIPWFLVGCLHYREASLNFKTYLGNGQPLGQVTTIVPKGRGPFANWYDGAIDALGKMVHPVLWDINGLLSFAEHYNGMGYARHGINSPYVWSGTDQYHSGLFTSDGNLDMTKVDHRPGVAAIIKAGGFAT